MCKKVEFSDMTAESRELQTAISNGIVDGLTRFWEYLYQKYPDNMDKLNHEFAVQAVNMARTEWRKKNK
jgi:hypothetical protein